MGLFKHHKSRDEDASSDQATQGTARDSNSLASSSVRSNNNTHAQQQQQQQQQQQHSAQQQQQQTTATKESLVTPAQIMEAAAKTEPESVNVIVGKTDHVTKVKEPIVQVQVRPREHEEITPMVERVREEMTVHQIIQPVIDQQHTVTHQEQTKEAINNQIVEPITAAYTEKYSQNATAMVAYEQVAETLRTQSMKGAVVTETVNKHTVFEIQPVIQREIDQETIVHTIQPIFEKWVHSPKVMELAIARPVTVEDYAVMKETVVGPELIKQTEVHSVTSRGLVEE